MTAIAAGMGSVDELATVIMDRLKAWPRHVALSAPGRRRAAVAITIVEPPTGPHVMLVKRAAGGRNAGQWALPGGRIEPDEDAVVAALRELAEETAIVRQPSDVLGVLDDFEASSGFTITPIVVAAPGVRQWRRNPAEIASLHPIPLGRLTQPGVPRWRETAEDTLLQMPLRHDMVVHAPTGAILWQFAQVCLLGQRLRLHGVAEPSFTAT